VLETGQPHQWEVKAPDGSIIEAYDFPFTDVDGSPLILEMDVDVTEQRQTQNALKKINETLEEQVKERTQELSKSNIELKRSNKELEQFAYISSHDLQEPLRMVTSFTQLLEKRYKDQLNNEADEYIEFIVEGAHRMKYLIDDLLAFSRLNTQPREIEIINLETVLNDVLSNLTVSLEESNAIITHDTLPTILADESQMWQVFQNLILNAIKFHGSNTPIIDIFANRDEKEWIFAVKDNGIGIGKEYQKQIFEVFKRLHTREKYPGSGIGLSISQKIIRRHGGNIWVESELGKGSTFYFTIPD
jgi:light-regulated signal transduction histidine kinase (bacteriophytochrome)